MCRKAIILHLVLNPDNFNLLLMQLKFEYGKY